jgi:hypothetical protein
MAEMELLKVRFTRYAPVASFTNHIAADSATFFQVAKVFGKQIMVL